MSAFLITKIIYAISIMFASMGIISCHRLRQTLMSHWKLLLLLILVNFCLKFPFCSPFFHGREYEDCFVHQAVARQLENQKKVDGVNPFRESIFSFGNIESGDFSQTFYNYIGYPTAICALTNLIGDRPQAGHIVSLVASCFNVLLVFLLAVLLNIHPSLPFIASSVYTLLPLGNIYSASTSADIFSSFYITLILLQIYLFAENNQSRFGIAVTYIGLYSCMIFSILVKRENIILLVLFPICYFFVKSQSGHITSRFLDVIKKTFLIVIPILIFQLIFLDLYSAFGEEAGASGNKFFAIRNLFILGPAYILSLGQFNFYLVFGIVLLVLPLIWFRLQATRTLIFVFLSYLCMYSAHYRSYYFLQTYTTSVWDTVRYMLNMLPLISILSSICIVFMFVIKYKITQLHLSQPLIIGSVIFLFLASIYTSSQLRTKLTNSEQEEVIQPILGRIKKLACINSQKYWIFTYRPCIYQIYGSRNLNLADLALVHKYDTDRLNNVLNSTQAYACLAPWDLNAINTTRYKEQTEWLRKKETPMKLEFQGMTIVELRNQP